MACKNCDDRKCMDCVFRIVHDRCEDDCPDCCAENVERMAQEEWQGMVERGARALYSQHHGPVTWPSGDIHEMDCRQDAALVLAAALGRQEP